MLTRKAIEELKAIHKKHYGTDLSDDEAWEMGNRLIRLYSVIYREPSKPHTKGTPIPPHAPPSDPKPGNFSSTSGYDIRYVNG